VDVLRAGKCCERLCGDLLATYQRKCTLGKIETFNHLASDEITNLWVKLYNICRVKTVMIVVLTVMSDMYLSHDLLGLVGLVLVGFISVEFVWFGVCNRWNPVGIVLILTTRVRLVSLSRLWL
jgi:hypothetical protein